MQVEEVVRKVLVDEHADVLRESVQWLAGQPMEVEVAGLIGAERGERTEDRATHRNGYRPRRWDTRAGEIELQIPKIRQGSYFPSFLAPRKRSEQALLSVVQEAHVCGVSTRRVDQLVESLGLRVSRCEVSRICAGLDEQVEVFRSRPLEGRYPYVNRAVPVARPFGSSLSSNPGMSSPDAGRSLAATGLGLLAHPGAVRARPANTGFPVGESGLPPMAEPQ